MIGTLLLRLSGLLKTYLWYTLGTLSNARPSTTPFTSNNDDDDDNIDQYIKDDDS